MELLLSCCLAFTAEMSVWLSESKWLLFVTSLNPQFPPAALVLLVHLCCSTCCFASKRGKGNIYLFFSPQ